MWLDRFNLKKSSADIQQTMFNRLYVSMRGEDWADWHTEATDESVLVLEGKAVCEVLLGDRIQKVELHEYKSGKSFYCRMPARKPHRVMVEGQVQIVRGTTRNPDIVRADDIPALPQVNGDRTMRMLRTGTEAFHVTEPVVTVGKAEISQLKNEIEWTPRTRIRLCAHKNANDLIHEMFVLYTNKTYIQPNKHIAKDETFHILEGEASFITYNDSGDVQDIVELGDYQSGKAFYFRVPEGMYHSVIMHSDYLVIHEATPGPYDRSATVWASWAKPQ